MTASWLVLVLGIAAGGVAAVSVGVYRTRWQSLPRRRTAPVDEAATAVPAPADEVMTGSLADRGEPAGEDEAGSPSAADRIDVAPGPPRMAVPPAVVPRTAPVGPIRVGGTASVTARGQVAAGRAVPGVPVEATAIVAAAHVAQTAPATRVASVSSIPTVPPALQPNRGPDTRSSYDVQSVDDLLAAAEAMSRPPAFGRAARRPARSAVPDAAPSTAGAARTGDSTDAVDAAVLDSLLSRLDGPRGTLRDAMIATYLDDGATLVGRLVMAALDGSTDAVLQIVPGLRSTCATLGAVRLDELLSQMQDAASADQPLAPLAWAVDAEHSRVTAALSVILEEPTRLG